jgi:hypothetical protein
LLVAAGCDEDQRRHLGDTCSVDGECTSGRCDETVCKAAAPAGIGEPCGHMYDCRSERCVDEVCAQGLRGPGQTCTDDQQCASNRCAAGSCGGATPDGSVGPGADAGPDGSAADGGSSDGGSSDGGPGVGWPKHVGGSLEDVVDQVTVGQDGNVYLSGTFASEALDFGGGPLSNAGEADAFVASFTPDGRHRWSRHFVGGFGGWRSILGVAVDPGGNAYVAGSVGSRTVDFGGGAMANQWGTSIFLVGLDATGGYRWARLFGGDSIYDSARAVGVDREGNAYLAGDFKTDTVDFGGGPLRSGAFVASFDAAGQHRWSESFSTLEDGALAVDLAGNSYFACTTTENWQSYLRSFDALGAVRWSREFTHADLVSAYDVALGGDGNVYVVGRFEATPVCYHQQELVNCDGSGKTVTEVIPAKVNLGGEDLLSQASYTPFAASFDPEQGTHRWSITLPGIASDYWYWPIDTVAGDVSGNVLLAGVYGSPVDLGGGTLPWSGGDHRFLLGLASDLSHRWSVGYAAAAVTSIAVDAIGGTYVAGIVSDVEVIDGVTLTSAGLSDVFLFKLEP